MGGRRTEIVDVGYDTGWSVNRATGDIFFTGDIHEYGAIHFIQAYQLAKQNSVTRPLVIHFSSPGGDVAGGLALYDAICGCPVEVTIIGWGEICSMAPVVFQAADTRLLNPHAVMMLHGAGIELEGSLDTVRAWEGQTRKDEERCLDILCERMKVATPSLTVVKLRNTLRSDRIFDANEAVEAGLADGLWDAF